MRLCVFVCVFAKPSDTVYLPVTHGHAEQGQPSVFLLKASTHLDKQPAMLPLINEAGGAYCAHGKAHISGTNAEHLPPCFCC